MKKFKLSIKYKEYFTSNYQKVIGLVLIVSSLYVLYFLYQNFYLVLINPEPVDYSSFVLNQDNTGDKIYQSIEVKIKEKEENNINFDELNDPF